MARGRKTPNENRLFGPTTHSVLSTVTETLMRNQNPNLLVKERPQQRRIMTQSRQSRKEPRLPTPFLSSRTQTKIGTWNVRTLYESGKAAQVANEMKRYGITVLGLSETHWIQSGQIRLHSGETILYSGHEEEDVPHTEGVGLMLSREAQQSLIEWEGHGSRIIHATFKTKEKFTFNIVQCYAPTNDKDEEVKEEFYDRLQSVIDNIGDRNVTILMGDLNAKVGDDNTGFEEVMGRHGLGMMNDNGEKFANFCAANQLVIGGSVFPHKETHKVTWRSPDNRTENQIDHICIGKKFRRSLQDVRAKRGADATSDHHLVVGHLKLKLKKNWTPQNPRIKYNTQYLKDNNKRQEFSVTLSNRFEVLNELLEEDELGMDDKWTHIKEAWAETCEEVLGRKTWEHKEWISLETLGKIEERRKKKERLNAAKTRARKTAAQKEYTEKHKEVRKSIKQDKRNYINRLALEAEEAAAKGNLRDLYDTTRKLSGKFKQTNIPVKDKNGQTLPKTTDQMRRWSEHFKDLLNRPRPPNPPDIQPGEEFLDINCERPSKEEIKKAISQLRNGKAAGPDNIPAEAIKCNPDLATDVLYDLFGDIWEKEEIPMEWKEGHLIKLPKKGDLADCKNYRGTMLLSAPSKVLNRILLERMRGKVDHKLRDQQAGFRRGRSCTDQIATLRIIIEQSIEWNSSLYVNFVDYEKAFDSIDRETMWKLLAFYGIPSKLLVIIKNSYEDMSCRVVHSGQLTENFPINTGVRQGCLLSPFLFLLFIDWIMLTTTKDRRNGIQWTLWNHLEDLDFADDLALLSHSHAQMQRKTDLLAEISGQTGLKIHGGKTKILRLNNRTDEPITLADSPLEEVDSFTYLGSVINKKGGADEDIKARIGKARGAYLLLKNFWKSKDISLNTKLRIFNTNVKTVLLYGSETWRTTKSNTAKLQTFINNCLRRILNIRWPNHISNKQLWERTRQGPIDLEIKKRKWRWIGHTLRKPVDCTTRQALKWNPQGKRRRGRPYNSWRRDLEAERRRLGVTWEEVERLAEDRAGWRTLINGLCSPAE